MPDADLPPLLQERVQLLLVFDEMFHKGHQFYALPVGDYWLAFYNGRAYLH